jgi:large subunit ribosomal protein L31e
MAEQKTKTGEQIYTIPLREVKTYPVWKRANKAIKVIRAYLSRHMKIDEENIKITAGLNEAIWAHGIEKPPAKIRVKATLSEDVVTAELVE